MVTTLTGVLEEKRAEARPNALYAQSWARAISLVRPAWRAEEAGHHRVPETLADGAGALALALYLIAAAEHIAPEAVTRAQVEALLPMDTVTGEYSGVVVKFASESTLPDWEARLRALGHDVDGDAGSDPVAVHWQALRVDVTPPDETPDRVWDDATLRVGYRLIGGLEAVLAPRYADDLAF